MVRTRRFIPLAVLALLLPNMALAQASKQSMVEVARLPAVQLHADWQAREVKASPAIKQNLATLRSRIQSEKLTFQVGYTEAMDKSLAQLTGLKVPANVAQLATQVNARAINFMKIDEAARIRYKIPPVVLSCSASQPAWDMRKQGKVTPIRNQATCGSCWDFAACAAWEVSNLIRNGATVGLSEQQILTCSGGGDCTGGWYMPVFDWMINHGVCAESACPYTHLDNPGSKAAWTALPSPNHAIAWGFVRPDAGIPSVADMKKAICAHGSVAVAFRATAGFQSYVGGIFNEHDPGPINHAVLLIGWDDAKQAWLMKNSWGTWWGDTCGYGTERGYCWIAYNSNSIGNHAAWVDAKRTAYIIPIDIIKQIDINILKSSVIPKHQ